MEPWVQAALTLAGALIASSGFWALVQRKVSMKSEQKRLLLVLAYDKIVTLGIGYVDRGEITRDELEAFRNDLYDPFVACGGNGITAQIMRQVEALPVRSHSRYSSSGQGGQS